MLSFLAGRVFRVCPRTGRIVGVRAKAWWLAPFVGLAALVWFLARVLPKPDRAAYPCQRASLSLAAGFVAWLLGTLGILAASRWVRDRAWRYRRLVLSASAASAVLLVLWTAVGLPPPTVSAWTPNDPANTPIGTPRGIHPGRVVWIRDAAATPWNDASGHWWDDTTGTNQAVVTSMLSRSIRSLTGDATDAAAWDALFRSHNASRGRGSVGYQSGETIAVKINGVSGTSITDTDNDSNASPHLLLSMLDQLVNQAGVPQDKITVYEAIFYITNYIYDKCRAAFPNVIYADPSGANGRAGIAWQASPFNYSSSDLNPAYRRDIPTFAHTATYIINCSLFKGHGTAGLTVTAKNHYGTIRDREHDYINCSAHAPPSYNPLVDLIGTQYLGGKTLLYMIDGLYGVERHSDRILVDQYGHWNTLFGGQWSASLFLSQDPVAIDSVGFDFINAEFPSGAIVNADNYLHEAALASKAAGASTDYKPDGAALSSLGVHEHWNSPAAKKYTRNLGTGSGIELVALLPEGESLPLPWRHQDVGAVGLAGGAALAGGTFSMSASGADIWGTADEFHYVYQPIAGDGSITVRVASLDNTDPWAKAGVMIRETLHPGSPNAAVFLTPGNGASFQWRGTAGGTSNSASGGTASAPAWLRLTRIGNTFSAYVSPDGSSWTLIGSQTIAMGSTVYVGLAVTSHNDAALNAAVMDSLSGTGGWDPSAGVAAGGDGGGEGHRCGLVGLELLAPLALLRLLRRRRSRAPRGRRGPYLS